MAALGLLKMNIFWNKGCDIIMSVHDFTNKILSHDPNYIVIWSCDRSFVTITFLWEKMYSYFIRIWPEKQLFLRGARFKFNYFGLALGMALKFYTSVAKGLKLIVKKFWELIPTFVEVTGEKLVGGSNTYILLSVFQRFNELIFSLCPRVFRSLQNQC